MTEHAQMRLRSYLSKLKLEEAIPETVFPFVELRSYSPGDFLCQSREPVSTLWIIVEGTCKVLSLSPDGKMIVVSHLQHGDFCGDLELFRGCTYLQTVQAHDEVTAICFPRHAIVSEMFQNAAFLLVLCNRFASKAYDSSKRYSAALLYPLSIRLAEHLVLQAESNESCVLQLRTDELGQYLGTTVRHLRRILSEFEEAGLIRRTSTETRIQDLDGLRALCASAVD